MIRFKSTSSHVRHPYKLRLPTPTSTHQIQLAISPSELDLAKRFFKLTVTFANTNHPNLKPAKTKLYNLGYKPIESRHPPTTTTTIDSPTRTTILYDPTRIRSRILRDFKPPPKYTTKRSFFTSSTATHSSSISTPTYTTSPPRPPGNLVSSTIVTVPQVASSINAGEVLEIENELDGIHQLDYGSEGDTQIKRHLQGTPNATAKMGELYPGALIEART